MKTVVKKDSVAQTLPIPNATNFYYDQRLLVKSADELPGAGLGLYTTESIPAGAIIGIYENYSGGLRPAAHRIMHHTNTSHYAVQHGGLVRDAWDPINLRPCCNTAYANDIMDSTKDNATFSVHDLYPDKLLMVATRDIAGSMSDPGPIYLPYGGYYWCDIRHPLEVQAQAVRRYNIDIRRSTESTDGLWRVLRNFDELCALFPDTQPEETARPTIPISAPQLPQQLPQKRKRKTPDIIPKDSRQKTLLAFITSSRTGVAARIDSPSCVMLEPRMTCFASNSNCPDSTVIAIPTLVCPDFHPLASSITPEMETSDREAVNHSSSSTNSQEDNPSAKQDNTAPVPCRTVLADLSYPHMEYDKKFVFI